MANCRNYAKHESFRVNTISCSIYIELVSHGDNVNVEAVRLGRYCNIVLLIAFVTRKISVVGPERSGGAHSMHHATCSVANGDRTLNSTRPAPRGNIETADSHGHPH